jgi:hypothetical protein
MTLTLSPAKVGTWALHEVLTSAQANKIASELVKAVDGVGGGSYSLTVADLTFTGSKTAIFDLAVQLTAGKTLTLDGAISVTNTGRINLASGAGINVNAGASVNLGAGAPGGVLSLAAGAALVGVAGSQLQGEFDLPSGSIIKFARAQDLALDTETFTRRLFMQPIFVDPAQWGIGTGGAPIWQQLNAVANPLLFPLVGCLPGDVITAIAAEIQASTGHGGVPSVQPSLGLFSKAGGGLTIASLAGTEDNQATVGDYETEHALVLNAGSLTFGAMPTIGTDPVYLQFGGEGSTNSQSGLKILSITVIGTRTKIANSHDFG